MPASHERVPQRPLSGAELREIIKKDVDAILNKDGMFTQNIAFGRVSYDVRVTLHLDNPSYPQHVTNILSKPASKQEVAKDPTLGSIETMPLSENSEEDAMVSQERTRQIASPNMARIENDMPILVEKRDMDTGMPKLVPVTYTGDKGEPESVGNTHTDKDTTEVARKEYRRPRK